MKFQHLLGVCGGAFLFAFNLAAQQDQDWAKLPDQSKPATQTTPAAAQAQPAQPAQAAQPVAATPAQPAQAAQSEQPTVAVQTNVPAQTAETVQATQPAQATQSAQPVETAQPVAATQPVTNSDTNQATSTLQPAVPAQAATPVAQTQPAQPTQTTQWIEGMVPVTELGQTTNVAQSIVAQPTPSILTTIPGDLVIDSADLIIYNAKVLVMDTNFTIAQAVAVRGNVILAVGRDKDLTMYQGPLTRVIDAQGRIVMPGLYDGNVSSWNAAVSELKKPLPVLGSIAAAQEYIRIQSTNKPAGQWIVLESLYPTRLQEGRLPTKAELDAASTNNPVVWSIGNLAVLNSKALELSRITKDTSDPLGGVIVKDKKTLKPTGILRDAAVALIKRPPPPAEPSNAQRRAALKGLYELYNRQGITSIAEQDIGTNGIDLLRSMSASNELTVRVNVTRKFTIGTNDIDSAVALIEAMTNSPTNKLPYAPTGAGDDWVRIGPLKVQLDGDVANASAYLRTPYGIGPTYKIMEPAYRGKLLPEPHVVSDLCLEAAQRGWQVSLHCSGDAALDFALNCYERAQFQLDIRDRRFAISHNDFQAPQNWERCAKLGVVANLDPTCLNEDGGSLLKTLGEPRLQWFLPFKSWFDRGFVVGAGSDHRAGTNSFDSTSPWNPWLGIWITLTRQTDDGTVLNVGECLSREQAIRLYTFNNAWNHFEERKKGSIELGKYADLIMIDTDILNCPVDDIRSTGVLLTLVNGKVVWEARNNWNVFSVSTRAPEPQSPQQPPQ